MRLPLEAASFKKFYGSSFLSDFTVVIQCETAAAAETRQPSDSNSSSHVQGSGTTEKGPQQPLLPEKTLDAPLLETINVSTAPCSGQHDLSAAAATAAAAARQLQSSLELGDHLQHPATAVPHAQTVSNRFSDSSISSSSCSSSGPESISLPVHGVVLAAASPYFETLLRDWKSSSNTLHMLVAEDQITAAQVLLQFMYTSTVPSTLPQHDLLQLLLLADRFDVRRAAAAASGVLGALSPAALEWATLQGIWSLPDHLFEAEEQSPVQSVAWDRLMQLFGDLETSWSTADGRNLWQQLPLRAVTALAASDQLAVASENTVFAALSSWITHAAVTPVAGRQLSQHDLRVLAASVRLPTMGPCYLSYVALQHDWFRQALDIISLARAAAYAAANSDVRKDLAAHTAATTSQALAAAAAGSSSGVVATCVTDTTGSSSSSTGGGMHSHRPSFSGCFVSNTADTSSSGPWGAAAAAAGSSSSRCGICPGCATPEQQAQLLSLAQAVQRPRLSSGKKTCFFQWHVDLVAIKQLHQEVAAAGSRDSRILRSPAHSFAGYEWALQLEITQVKGTTGFDASKPWALGVFLTCQVRVEVPNKQQEPAAAAAAGLAAVDPTAAAGDGGQAGGLDGSSSSSNSAASSKQPPSVAAAAVAGTQQQQQQQQLLMQLVDFGFVSTAATISVREVGGKDKKCEKSWEHAVVRYRASWGWPNYLDVSVNGWDEAAFDKWLIDGQMHLQGSVRVLG